ncbi:MAG: WD40/YVTN/BNR-like repeat-containing protein [Actinomycetota bacterium]
MSFSIFVSTTWRGISRAELTGGSWQVSRLLKEQETRSLASSRDGLILVGTQGNGVLRSDDAGVSWAPSGLDGMIVKSLAISPADPRVVYAGTKPPGIFKSGNGGRDWVELAEFQKVRKWWWRQPAERPTVAYVSALAPAAADPDVIVAGIEAGAVLRTDDGGSSWQGHLKGAARDCHALSFHRSASYVYEGGGGVRKPGAAISTDAGVTWSRVVRGPDVKYGWAVVGDHADPETWYVALAPGPMRAHIDGKAEAYLYRHDAAGWTRLSGGLPQPMKHMVYALVSDARGLIYAGLASGRIWHSIDRGESWTEMSLDLGAIHRSLVAL